MVTWIMRVYVGLIVAYVGYLMIVAGLHTVCDCLR